MAEVKLMNVTKTFGKVKAVDNVILHVKDKEFVVLLGPSGCGKTTTLRCVAGLERVDKGKIYIGDRDVTPLPPGKRNLSMVFQSYAVFPHLTVFRNLAFGLELKKTAGDEIKRKVKAVAELLRIEELLDRYPHQLSGGQRQRVALGRALAVEPEILLLDEPLSNLDALLRLRMRVELKRLHKKIGYTIIYVTHDQAEAMTMGSRVAIMQAGKIVQLGAPTELYDSPANKFVAEFLGSPTMNFISGILKRKGKRVSFNFDGLTYPIPTGQNRLLAKVRTLSAILGVRPEDVRVSPKRVPNSLEGRAIVTQPLGSDNLITTEVGNSLLTARVEPTTDVETDQKVWITLKNEKIHFFDAKDEKNLLYHGKSV